MKKSPVNNQLPVEMEVKEFGELSLEALYDLLQLRSEIFVVEQDCVYLDIDGKDQKALHVLGYKEGTLIAYARCFPPGEYFREAAIGRVLVRESERAYKYGHHLMKASIEAIENRFQTAIIKLSAQAHLKKFYESHGFQQVGEGYLEDGIPHIAMLRNN